MCSAAVVALLGCGAPAPGGGAGPPIGARGAALGSEVPRSVPLDRDHVVYLTFDDGPLPETTPEVLRVLRAHGAAATFFITGLNIAGNEALLRREDREGHQVANHQLVHEIAPPPGSSSTFRAWAREERIALDQALGHRHTRYFRYPYGEGSTAKERVLRDLGYPDGGFGWDIDTLDWCFGDGGGTCDLPEVPPALRDDFLGYVRARIEAAGGGVLLLHDVQARTAASLDELLDWLEEEGYEVAPLPDP